MTDAAPQKNMPGQACEDEESMGKNYFYEKLCIVTGGASGIGEATARLLAGRGAKVVIVDVNDPAGETLAVLLGPGSSYRRCDVSDEKAVEKMVSEVLQEYKRPLHAYINSAGIFGAFGLVDEIDVASFDTTLAVNARGTFLGIKHASRAMKDQAVEGAIVNLSSTAGVKGGLAPAAYTASKFAVVGLTQQAACDLAPYGIRVNCVSPTGLDTPMVRRFLNKDPDRSVAEALKDMQAFPRAATPEDAARAIAFLCSDQAASISGHNLIIDCAQLTGVGGRPLGDYSKQRGEFLGTKLEPA